jgi:hypothetical protein
VFVWQWVRGFSPMLNLYTVGFLFGGAVYSAVKYFANDKGRTRFLGNIFIAIGAIFPGIGGSFTRFDYVEVLYVTELVGLSFIYLCYHIIRSATQSPCMPAKRELTSDNCHGRGARDLEHQSYWGLGLPVLGFGNHFVD